MKAIGYLFIVVSFLLTSTIASLQPNLLVDAAADPNVNWTWFLPALAIGVAGIAMVRLGEKQAHTEDSLGAGMDTLSGCLDRVTRHIRELDEGKSEIDVYDLHARIDERFPDDLNAFADARKTIIHVHGLDAYARVMNAYAAGERYLNRVWSASIDGYVDEARAYLGHSRREFDEARRQLGSLAG